MNEEIVSRVAEDLKQEALQDETREPERPEGQPCQRHHEHGENGGLHDDGGPVKERVLLVNARDRRDAEGAGD